MRESNGEFIHWPSGEKEMVAVKHLRPMTALQITRFEFIQERIRFFGYPPTYRELADRFGTSTRNEYLCVEYICRKGWLYKSAKKGRSISIVAAVQTTKTGASNALARF